MSEAASEDVRSLTFLDQSGDFTLVWDDESEDTMVSLIERKMSEGLVFYVMKPRMLPTLPPKKARAKSIEDVKASGCVVIKDADITKLLTSGEVAIGKAPAEIGEIKREPSPRKVARSQAVAVRPARGG